MKKYLLGAILFAVPFVAFADFQTNLSYGSTGTDVLALQEFLTEQGVYSGPISGNFYSLTLAAVKRFQTQEGVTPISGFFGPITRGVANNILSAEVPADEGNATTTHAPVNLTPQPESTAPTNNPVEGGIITVMPQPAQAAPQASVDCTLGGDVSSVTIPRDNGNVTPGMITLTWTTSNAVSATLTSRGFLSDPNTDGGVLPIAHPYNGTQHPYHIPPSELPNGAEQFSIDLDMVGRTQLYVLTAYDAAGNSKQCTFAVIGSYPN